MPSTDEAKKKVTMRLLFKSTGEVDSLRIECNGGWHRAVVTEAHEVKLLDHNQEEIDAEMAFVKLGGSPCPCVMLLMWEREHASKKTT